MADAVFAEQLFETNSYELGWGSRFFSSILEKGSMWVFGRDEMSNKVLWHVNVPDFKVLREKTIEDPRVNSPIIMISFGKQILFAEKGGCEIYGINTETQLFETIFKDVSFQIDAMCCNDDHLYIFQKKFPDVIQILDPKFQSVGKIPTGFKESISKCEVDLCTTTMRMSTSTQDHSSSEIKTKHQHVCIISMSKPTDPSPWYPGPRAASQEPTDGMAIWHPYVRPLNEGDSIWQSDSRIYPSVKAVTEAGVIWQLDSRSCPELDARFNPCSVSSSATGDIFIADNGADRVSNCLILVTS